MASDDVITATRKLSVTHGEGGAEFALVQPDAGKAFFNGNTGIRVLNPLNTLDVNGAVAIGSGFAGVAVAPANGLIVEGNVGIGTKSPNAKLEVAGNIRAVELALTGPLTLPGPPTADLHAATKRYVGDQTKAAIDAHTSTPNPHSGFLAKTGDTMTGELKITATGKGLSVSGNASVGGLTVGKVDRGMTVGPWPANPDNYVFVGVNSLNQAAAGNYALLQGQTEGRTFLNSPLDIRFRIGNVDQMIVTNAKLEVKGSISSPMWNLTQVFNMKVGPLPISGRFNSGGGILVIFVSGSGYSPPGERDIGMKIMVDNLLRGEARRFANEKLSHKTFVSNPLIVAGLASGDHTLSLLAQEGTATDSFDLFSATVLELPW